MIETRKKGVRASPPTLKLKEYGKIHCNGNYGNLERSASG